jgi:hypothetical protein
MQFNLPNYAALQAVGGPLQWVQFIRRTGTKEKRKKHGIFYTFDGKFGRREIGGYLSIKKFLQITWSI